MNCRNCGGEFGTGGSGAVAPLMTGLKQSRKDRMSSCDDRISFWNDINCSWKDSTCSSSAAMADLSDAMSVSVSVSKLIFDVFRAVAPLLTDLWQIL